MTKSKDTRIAKPENKRAAESENKKTIKTEDTKMTKSKDTKTIKPEGTKRAKPEDKKAAESEGKQTIKTEDTDKRKAYIKVISDNISNGENFLAQDAALHALKEFPNDYEIRQLAGLTLLRTGAIDEAEKIIGPLIEHIQAEYTKETEKDTGIDFELLGKIYYARWQRTQSITDMRTALNNFRKSNEIDHGVSAGIHAAILLWIDGGHDDAVKMALKVLESVKAPHGGRVSDKQLHQHYASLGMLNLLRNHIQSAKENFQKAINIAKNRFYLNSSILQHIEVLRTHGFTVPEVIEVVLEPPRVIVFSGPTIDRPNAKQHVFPPEMEKIIAKEIKIRLQELDAKIGFCSAACGGDILFIEAMLERGGEVEVILPFNKESMVQERVGYAGEAWVKRFENVLKKVHRVHYVSEDDFLGYNTVYLHAHRLRRGYAIMRAEYFHTTPHLLVVLDPFAHHKLDFSTELMDLWHNIPTLHLIDLDDLKEKHGLPRNTLHLPKRSRSEEGSVFHVLPPTKNLDIQRQIKAMMFSDLHGYSQLRDKDMPGFLHFMNKLSQEMEPFSASVQSVNTWGDAIFVVMEDPFQLANYALKYAESVYRISSQMKELPFALQPRVSLHSGPVYMSLDPFLKKQNYFGENINRAARLEPVTSIGQVYATKEFVASFKVTRSLRATLADQSGETFKATYDFDYVGVMSLAKNFGAHSVYHVRRK
jgi:class 3 adenylate cyclase/tetratricopeptide (TPR) repeat protein